MLPSPLWRGRASARSRPSRAASEPYFKLRRTPAAACTDHRPQLPRLPVKRSVGWTTLGRERPDWMDQPAADFWARNTAFLPKGTLVEEREVHPGPSEVHPVSFPQRDMLEWNAMVSLPLVFLICMLPAEGTAKPTRGVFTSAVSPSKQGGRVLLLDLREFLVADEPLVSVLGPPASE